MTTQLARRLSILLALALPLTACDRPAPDARSAAVREPSHETEAGVAPAEHFAPTPVVLATTTRGAVAPGGAPSTVVARRVAPSALPAAGSLTLRRAVVAADVVDHEPVGASDTFAASETAKLFVFLDVRNDAATPAELTVSFVRTDVADARERGGVTLTVPASARRFRTWAYTRQVHDVGAWSAIVRDADGGVVARLPFVVGA